MSPDSPDPIAETNPSNEFPTRFQRKTFWTAITAVAIVVIAGIAVGGVYLATGILSYLQPVLVPLAIAGIVAFLLDPIINWLKKKGWPHTRAMLTVFVGFLLLVVLLAVAVIVPTFGQAQEFYQDREEIQAQVTTFIEKEIAWIQERIPLEDEKYRKHYQRGVEWLSEEGPKLAGSVGTWVWDRLRGTFGLFGYIIGLFLVPVYLFFFLKEGHVISETWSDYLPLRASNFKDEVVGTMKEINQYLISFFRGQMVVSMIDGGLVAIALLLMGMPYALLIGVFLAILGLIPYIGNLMVMIPAVVIAIAHFGATETGSVVGDAVPELGAVAKIVVTDGASTQNYQGVVTAITNEGRTVEILSNAWDFLPHVWAYPLIVLGIFFTLQQVNGLVTAPKIVGDSVGLHPLTVIFSVLFWGLLLGGLLGALLAVPLTAAVKVLFRRYIWERRLESVVGERLGRGRKPKDRGGPDRVESASEEGLAGSGSETESPEGA